MKKILSLSTVVAALFLAACAEKKEEAPADTESMVKATEAAAEDMAKEAEKVAEEAKDAVEEAEDAVEEVKNEY